MAEQQQENGVQVEKKKKGFSGIFMVTILLLCTLVVAIIVGLWTLRLSSQVSSLSMELKTLQTYDSRLTLVEDKLAKLEIKNRLQVLKNSIDAITGLAATFRQVDAAKADELQGVVTELTSEADLLQKQLDNYQQAIKKPLAAGADVPSLQARSESPQGELEDKTGSGQKTNRNWWEKIVNFRFFDGRK